MKIILNLQLLLSIILLIKRGGGGDFEIKPYIFHILTDKIENQSEEKLKKLEQNLNLKYPCEIQIHTMSDKDFQGKGKWKGSFVANFILKFDEVLSDEVDKALCLDVDMFVFTDLRELFELDLKDKIAAVAHSLDNTLGHFNSGFVLFNVKEYKRLNLRKQTLDYLIKHNPKYPDQDTLNAIIKDKRLILSPIWNFFPHNKNLMPGLFKNESEYNIYSITREKYENLLKGVKIAHFLLCPKPWFSKFALTSGYPSLFRDFWWENALRTPVFKEELFKIHQALKDKEVEDLALVLETSLDLPTLFRSQIEYKLGSVMIKYSKMKQGYLRLPFVLAKLAIKYKIAKTIYEFLSFYNPKFKANDVEQILKKHKNDLVKMKEHLSYKLGVALIKAHKAWYKGGFIKFYFEAKALEREFESKKVKQE